jgi:cob(I)alamin adenosyltransferase
MLAVLGTAYALEKLLRLDAAIARYNADLPPLKEFILPGGARPSALCHVARSVARRAERDLFHLLQSESVSLDALRYLNRLSDLLFVLARTLNRTSHNNEMLWNRS